MKKFYTKYIQISKKLQTDSTKINTINRLFWKGAFMLSSIDSVLILNCLQEKERPQLPSFLYHLPQSWQQYYLLRYQPWRKTDESTYCLQTDRENCFRQPWREKAAQLLQTAQENGAKIVISPLAADLPQGILPFATGRHLTLLCCMQGAEEALRRKQIAKEQARFVLIDGGTEDTHLLLSLLPDWVNHFALCTDHPVDFMDWQEDMLANRGLVTELFSSLGHQALKQAHVVLTLRSHSKSLVHTVASDAYVCMPYGNPALLAAFQQQRPDVAAVDGFFFSQNGTRIPCTQAEAWAYCHIAPFALFHQTKSQTAAKNALLAFQEQDFCVCGFQSGTKTCKIAKKQSH